MPVVDVVFTDVQPGTSFNSGSSTGSSSDSTVPTVIGIGVAFAGVLGFFTYYRYFRNQDEVVELGGADDNDDKEIAREQQPQDAVVKPDNAQFNSTL